MGYFHRKNDFWSTFSGWLISSNNKIFDPDYLRSKWVFRFLFLGHAFNYLVIGRVVYVSNENSRWQTWENSIFEVPNKLGTLYVQNFTWVFLIYRWSHGFHDFLRVSESRFNFRKKFFSQRKKSILKNFPNLMKVRFIYIILIKLFYFNALLNQCKWSCWNILGKSRSGGIVRDGLDEW